MSAQVGIFYYSFEGNTQFIAETIQQSIGGKIIPVKPISSIPHAKVLKYFYGGKQALLHEVPPIESLVRTPGEFDIIFIGTPVWAFSYAPAIRALFAHYHIVDKVLALFCCHRGMPGITISAMKKQLAGNRIIAEHKFYVPLSDTQQNKERVQLWAEQTITQSR